MFYEKKNEFLKKQKYIRFNVGNTKIRICYATECDDGLRALRATATVCTVTSSSIVIRFRFFPRKNNVSVWNGRLGELFKRKRKWHYQAIVYTYHYASINTRMGLYSLRRDDRVVWYIWLDVALDRFILSGKSKI